ncbi:hypothetical protein SeMB42_g05619 [Synchytrium endobioticum]|uniref:Uncharacterized protein n=1 Tax=Synchytrium endobioticum TaxID=286115 RepID=A0A507CQF2_9FUNG|nr:hypothetical protein SeMB42_g05619 [Synchytrium endobioticum]TPX50605.1 hypothetical protein SeLEV6574_g00813 [Synchytrium endobioticum]
MASIQLGPAVWNHSGSYSHAYEPSTETLALRIRPNLIHIIREGALKEIWRLPHDIKHLTLGHQVLPNQAAITFVLVLDASGSLWNVLLGRNARSRKAARDSVPTSYVRDSEHLVMKFDGECGYMNAWVNSQAIHVVTTNQDQSSSTLIQWELTEEARTARFILSQRHLWLYQSNHRVTCSMIVACDQHLDSGVVIISPELYASIVSEPLPTRGSSPLLLFGTKEGNICYAASNSDEARVVYVMHEEILFIGTLSNTQAPENSKISAKRSALGDQKANSLIVIGNRGTILILSAKHAGPHAPPSLNIEELLIPQPVLSVDLFQTTLMSIIEDGRLARIDLHRNEKGEWPKLLIPKYLTVSRNQILVKCCGAASKDGMFSVCSTSSEARVHTFKLPALLDKRVPHPVNAITLRRDIKTTLSELSAITELQSTLTSQNTALNNAITQIAPSIKILQSLSPAYTRTNKQPRMKVSCNVLPSPVPVTRRSSDVHTAYIKVGLRVKSKESVDLSDGWNVMVQVSSIIGSNECTTLRFGIRTLPCAFYWEREVPISFRFITFPIHVSIALCWVSPHITSIQGTTTKHEIQSTVFDILDFTTPTLSPLVDWGWARHDIDVGGLDTVGRHCISRDDFAMRVDHILRNRGTGGTSMAMEAPSQAKTYTFYLKPKPGCEYTDEMDVDEPDGNEDALTRVIRRFLPDVVHSEHHSRKDLESMIPHSGFAYFCVPTSHWRTTLTLTTRRDDTDSTRVHASLTIAADSQTTIHAVMISVLLRVYRGMSDLSATNWAGVIDRIREIEKEIIEGKKTHFDEVLLTIILTDTEYTYEFQQPQTYIKHFMLMLDKRLFRVNSGGWGETV